MGIQFHTLWNTETAMRFLFRSWIYHKTGPKFELFREMRVFRSDSISKFGLWVSDSQWLLRHLKHLKFMKRLEHLKHLNSETSEISKHLEHLKLLKYLKHLKHLGFLGHLEHLESIYKSHLVDLVFFWLVWNRNCTSVIVVVWVNNLAVKVKCSFWGE